MADQPVKVKIPTPQTIPETPDKASFYRHHIEILAEKTLPDG